MSYDITTWELIRYPVERVTATLLEDVHKELLQDPSLRELQGNYPIPWQLREVMQHRANTWVERLYDLCCDAYKRTGKELSAEFDRAVWAYCIEPFIMGEVRANNHGRRPSVLLELLLCAVGSPPENRKLLKVGQKHCCMAVRATIYETWYDKLHHLPPRIDKVVADIAHLNAMDGRAARIAAGPPPEPSPLPAALPNQFSKSSQAAPARMSPKGTESHVQPASTGSEDKQNRVTRHNQPVQSGGVGTATWEDIEISFLSDERVQIRNGTKRETRNYSEFGFEDRRSGKPNRAWETLRAMAERRGLIQEPTQAHQNWPRVEKRIQEIRKILRKHFGIPCDPIPFVEGAGYQARFKIGCGPSYRT